MKCGSLKARRAADDKSAMLWVCYHCQQTEQTVMTILSKKIKMFGTYRYQSQDPIHLPVWAGCISLVIH